MKTYKARSLAVLLLIVSSLFTVSVLISSPQPTASLIVHPQRPGASSTPRSQKLYAKAADALRKGNLQAARQQLDSIAAQHPDQAAQAQVVAGLYAHQAGNDRLAGELLAAAPAPGGCARGLAALRARRERRQARRRRCCASPLHPPDRRATRHSPLAAGRLPGGRAARRRQDQPQVALGLMAPAPVGRRWTARPARTSTGRPGRPRPPAGGRPEAARGGPPAP